MTLGKFVKCIMCLSSIGCSDVKTLGFNRVLFSYPLWGKGFAWACAVFVSPYTCCTSVHKICFPQCLRYNLLRTWIFVYKKSTYTLCMLFVVCVSVSFNLGVSRSFTYEYVATEYSGRILNKVINSQY